jgi:Tol biopolymer transport system component
MNNKIMIEEGNNQEESIIIFSGNLDIGYDKTQTPGRHQECYLDLYKWDLNRPEEQPQSLTHSFDEWDEHGHFSPSGENIAYISSKGLMEGVEFPLSWWTVLKTDYWLMKENSTKTKLTYFNKPEQEIVDKTTEKRYTCADSSWNSDGSKLAVVVGHATGEKMEGSFIAIMEFKEKK